MKVIDIEYELVHQLDEEIKKHVKDYDIVTGKEYTRGLIDGLILARNGYIKPVLASFTKEED
jgi:hypothetical protein